jgi:hypothetical protein
MPPSTKPPPEKDKVMAAAKPSFRHPLRRCQAAPAMRGAAIFTMQTLYLGR